jgi:hypothetical protein
VAKTFKFHLEREHASVVPYVRRTSMLAAPWTALGERNVTVTSFTTLTLMFPCHGSNEWMQSQKLTLHTVLVYYSYIKPKSCPFFYSPDQEQYPNKTSTRSFYQHYQETNFPSRHEFTINTRTPDTAISDNEPPTNLHELQSRIHSQCTRSTTPYLADELIDQSSP